MDMLFVGFCFFSFFLNQFEFSSTFFVFITTLSRTEYIIGVLFVGDVVVFLFCVIFCLFCRFVVLFFSPSNSNL